jgi:hypothetical protein
MPDLLREYPTARVGVRGYQFAAPVALAWGGIKATKAITTKTHSEGDSPHQAPKK